MRRQPQRLELHEWEEEETGIMSKGDADWMHITSIQRCVTQSREVVISVNPCECLDSHLSGFKAYGGLCEETNTTGYVTWWNLCVCVCQGK